MIKEIKFLLLLLFIISNVYSQNNIILNWGITTIGTDSTNSNHSRAIGGLSPNILNMKINSISIYLGKETEPVRLAIYTGGQPDNPSSATLLWDAGIVTSSGTKGWYTISHPTGIDWQPNTFTWLAWKRNNGTTVFYNTNSSYCGNFQSERGRNNNSFNQSPSIGFPTNYGEVGTFYDAWYSIYLTYTRPAHQSFYVANNGSDTNDGTFLYPFKTINRAVSVAEAGDTIYVRGGEYKEMNGLLNQLRINKSGQSGFPIVIKNYEAEKPIINQTKQITSNWSNYSGYIYVATVPNEIISGHPNYGNPIPISIVTIDTSLLYSASSLASMTKGSFYQDGANLYVWTPYDDSPENHIFGMIKDFLESADWHEAAGVYITGDYIEMSGFEIRNSSGMGIYCKGSYNKFTNNKILFNSSCGFKIVGTANGDIITGGFDNEFSDNEVMECVLENWPRYSMPDFCPLCWAGAIAFNCCKNGKILRNKVYRNHGEGISTGGAAMGLPSSVGLIISENELWDNYSVQIYIHGSSDCVVDKNFMYNTGRYPPVSPNLSRNLPGITTALETWSGSQYSHLKNNVFTNNIVVNAQCGFQFFCDYDGSGISDYIIANNTFVNSRWVGLWLDGFSGSSVCSHTNNIIQNNIFIKRKDWIILLVENVDSTNIFTHNLFYNYSGNQLYSWNGNNYYSLNSLFFATGQGDSCIWGNPLLSNITVADSFENFVYVDVDKDNFKLNENSPAIDKGKNISTILWDGWGTSRPQGSNYDIGAFEFININNIKLKLKLFLQGAYSLEQNFPNPFNPSTTIKYTIPYNIENKLVPTTLKIYNILGQEITTLVNDEQEPGIYEVEFNAKSLSSGVYFYKLIAGNFTDTKKMIVLK